MWNHSELSQVFCSSVDYRGAGGARARATPEFEGSEKWTEREINNLVQYYKHPWIRKAIYGAAFTNKIIGK